MTIRHLVVAAFLLGAGAAQADTISSPPTFLSGWTAGNGVDVLGSGVIQGNVKLIGGVSHAAQSADTSLADILYGKAAATIAQDNGQTTMFFKRGITGDYLLGSNMAIMAAAMGTSTSLVGSGNGAVIQNGAPATGVTAGGGGLAGTPTGAGSSGSTGSASSGSSGSTGSGSSGSSDSTGSGSSGSSGSTGSGSGNASAGADIGAVIPGVGSGSASAGLDVGVTLPSVTPAADVNAVPEPASLALMLAGVLGAGAIRRRRG